MPGERTTGSGAAAMPQQRGMSRLGIDLSGVGTGLVVPVVRITAAMTGRISAIVIAPPVVVAAIVVSSAVVIAAPVIAAPVIVVIGQAGEQAAHATWAVGPSVPVPIAIEDIE